METATDYDVDHVVDHEVPIEKPVEDDRNETIVKSLMFYCSHMDPLHSAYANSQYRTMSKAAMRLICLDYWAREYLKDPSAINKQNLEDALETA